jgi:hypothetical protein
LIDALPCPYASTLPLHITPFIIPTLKQMSSQQKPSGMLQVISSLTVKKYYNKSQWLSSALWYQPIAM